MDQPFKIDIRRGAGSDTVQFHGNIDAHADQHFDDLIRQVSTNRVIMDFSHTGRINSMGIALLLRSIKSIKSEKKAEVSIQGLNQINTMLFKMTGIFLLASDARTV
jgi:anti-anti-sigma factor